MIKRDQRVNSELTTMDSDNPRLKALKLLNLSSIAYLEAYEK